jgi:DNA-binding IclR family transcriptional regulator
LLVHRSTAVRYLDTLVEAQMLSKHKLGKDNYYFNTALYRLLDGVGERLMTGKPL